MSEAFIESSLTKQDALFETPLRPKVLDDFIGQESIREQLSILISAAKMRREPLPHALFFGPPGLGKTTLAHILSTSMGTHLVTTSGAALEKAGDLAGLLSNLQPHDILFIDEIHRLPRTLEEYLYPALEDFKLDLMIDSGPAARSVQIQLQPFTLVGATTRSGLISSPLRSRFGFSCRLNYYDPTILKEIVMRSSSILRMPIDHEGALAIAQCSRGTPRIANNLFKWVRDFAQTKNISRIDKETAKKALAMLSIDDLGLDEMDKKILSLLIEHHQGNPVGLSTIAVAVGEEPETIAEVFEPYLIMQGFLRRTPRGRVATPLAYRHLFGMNYPYEPIQGELP